MMHGDSQIHIKQCILHSGEHLLDTGSLSLSPFIILRGTYCMYTDTAW